ncbi:MAG: WXG100 family type VII secretion target [Lachnospiraceae bacterium]|nr:WXG100 family type VII secretion target [Lachnospiraceae bacterium]
MAERMANDLTVFDGDINDYGNHYQSLVGHFGDMVDHMNALNNMWEGEAHDEFLATFETDRTKTQEMIDDFKKVMDELRFAHTEYTECENSIANMIEQMPI